MNINPLVIPIFIPHSGCPHQCAFCNQSIITDKVKTRITEQCKSRYKSPKATLPSQEQIRQEVDRFLEYKGSRQEVQLAFFGGNFLGLEPDDISLLLSYAQDLVNENKINSIRFSTRPDTITRESLELIAPYPVSTVEIGVQSMNDTVLKMAQRGHTAKDTIKAASLLKLYKSKIQPTNQIFETGMQIMVGLLGDNDETALDTAQKITSLEPDFVRIYPLIVLEGSLIAKWYRQGTYKPMSLDSCVKLVKEMFLIFQKHNIPVVRMGLQSSDLLQDKASMLAGPWHPAFGHLVYSELFFDKVLELVHKKIAMAGICPDTEKVGSCNTNLDRHVSEIILTVHPSSLSRLRGDKNHNIKRLKDIYPSTEFQIRTDASLDKHEIM
ncbi:MAG: radical SAM protein [Desulfamplus sp.]|nr:radical SAM protein [Desulfamplus sp.]